MIEELAKECRKPEWTVEKKDLSDIKNKLEDETQYSSKGIIKKKSENGVPLYYHKNILLIKSWLLAFKKTTWSWRAFIFASAVAFSSRQVFNLTVAELSKFKLFWFVASSSANFFWETHEDNKTTKDRAPRKEIYDLQN